MEKKEFSAVTNMPCVFSVPYTTSHVTVEYFGCG